MRHLFSIPLGQEIAPKAIPKNSWVGAAIGAVGSLAGGLLTNQSNANLNKENRDWQTARDYVNFQRTKQLFDYENAYNTPSAQRQRLQEAGYNPWISGSGGMANTGQIPHSPGMSSAPSSIPMQDPVGPAIQALLQSKSVDASVANQQAQADKTNAEAFAYIYKNVGKDAAIEWGKQHNFNADPDSYLSRSLELSIEEQQADIQKKQLQNSITEKYGAKEAESRIANLEQLTTKYVGELGLMSARADLTRSEIELNNKRAYELGARAAQEFASARLFGSEAKINEDTLQYVVGQAKLSYNSNKLSYFEQFAGFQSRTGVRSYMTSPEGISRQTWNYMQSPEGNYVSAFINGFTNSAKLSFGVNYNYSRSFGTNRSYGNSWIYNAKDFYPVGR